MQLIPQLINSLADEKVRWQDTVESLDDKINNSSGDVLVAAGFVAYLGPFTVSVQWSAHSLQLCCPGQGERIGHKGARSLQDLCPLVQKAAQDLFEWEQEGLGTHNRLAAT